RDPGEVQGQFPQHSPRHHRQRFRRLGQGTADSLRRWRRVRHHLSAGKMTTASIFSRSTRSRFPGFGLSLGLTLFYLTGIVLVPLLALVLRPFSLHLEDFWTAISAPRVLAALRLSFGTALAAAAIDSLFGFIVAWVLVRYRFPGKRLMDALIDLPFALPTAVAG